MKVRKIILTMVLTILGIGMMISNSFAAVFDLDIYFDGKTISMQSENQNMELNVSNLLPGETDRSYLNLNNKGSKSVKLYMTADIENGKELLDVLEVSILDNSQKEIFKGNYSKFDAVEIELPEGSKGMLTIITTLPTTVGNDYQSKESNIKFTFVASGEPNEEITTNVIETPKTGQSKIIYIVLLAIVIVLLIAIIILTVNKKKEEKED